MKRVTGPIVGCMAALALAASPNLYADPDKDESGKGRGHKEYRGENHRGKGRDKDHDRDRGERHSGRSYFHERGYTRLDIPAGHYPPPGECRVWYPDRPPGHQPPPGGCGGPVPPGAWLIRHPVDAGNHVYVTVYEPSRPSAVLVVGAFAIGSGALVRVVLQE